VHHDRPGFLYNVSWEVCNRVGGVHTVLETIAPHLVASYGKNMLFVGPDLWADRAAQVGFIEDNTSPPLAHLAAERGVPVRFGRCELEGNPRVALIDYGRLLERKNSILGELWDDHHVDSIHADWDTIDRILFGYAAGILVELHYRVAVRPRGLRAVAHFHQWQAAAGILRIASTTPEIGTVLTPHGTALGRALASSGVRVDRALASIDMTEAPTDENVAAQHTLEVAAAKQAQVLATVSEHAAEEAEYVLGRRPDIVTPNGYRGPTVTDPARRKRIREEILTRAERFLGTKLDRDATQIALTAARYEYRNKGLDLIVSALGRLVASNKSPKRKLLLIVAVAAPQTGPRPEVTERLASAELAGKPCGRSTHKLAHPESDEILRGCTEAGLTNQPEDDAYVMFVPVRLDGTDSVLPFTYDEVLRASDVSIFPSLYEPWGYTPVESLAVGVPTVTTDLTGFGRYLLEHGEEAHRGVLVLPLASASGDDVDSLLDRAITDFLDTDDDSMAEIRADSARVLERVQWDKLIGKTLSAHEKALEHAGEARVAMLSPSLAGRGRRSVISLSSQSAERPHLHNFTVVADVPAKLRRMVELARNMWWSWHPEVQALFRELDPDRFEAARGNPVELLNTLPESIVATAAANADYCERCETVIADFDRYMARKRKPLETIAYFSAEFALHECLPVYSGGLGVLAGDHLKSASDLALPLSAVGLRYADGYFRQRIGRDGKQLVEPQHADPSDLPMTEVLGPDGEPLRITIPMPEHDLHAGVWRVDVGQVPLFLLDTLVAENDDGNQDLTRKLYPSEREWRLRQEILLGMGGWRMLRAIDRQPAVCHLNEGHSAFLLLERLLELVEESGLTFDEAAVVVRGSSLFTTHTPVPAGHDRFHEELMRRYFAGVATRLGLDWKEFFDLGRVSEEDDEFSMTTLALRLTGRANGVSKLHGEVSRNMLADTWPGLHEAETPVSSVTNGVHLPTWCGPVLRPALDKALGRAWLEEAMETGDWARIAALNDAEIWHIHTHQKRGMLDFVRDRIERTSQRRGVGPATIRRRLEGLTEDALIIGYARRFAPYKRATLLFRDPERLAELLADEQRPVRILYAGKAHPDDGAGSALVQEIVAISEDPRFEGKVFFIEDYDMDVARKLTTGVDVWLNTPTRPLEASGTSGMKAALNGVLHASILDGWWCEGYDGTNGFAIGDGEEGDDPEALAAKDSRSLYRMLETEMVPEFFTRRADGRPQAWIERMRRSIATVPPFFSTHRMVSDYAKFGYAPLGKSSVALSANSFAAARTQAQIEDRLRAAWPEVQIQDVSVTDARDGNIGIGEPFEVRARVALGDLAPDQVRVELYVGHANDAEELVDPVVVPLARTGETDNGTAEFSGGFMPTGAGRFRYGVRVRPNLEDDTQLAHLGLVQWA